MTANESALRGAITNQHVVTCTYRGCPRTVHPLVVLVNDDGERVLHCWQVAGESSSGRTPPFWDNFTIHQITDLEVTPETFTGPPADYNPGRFSEILCAVPRDRRP
ncbi:MAG TPA: WYL domain-containing protein [Urbifossiella sp.]|nr:WYL domain-containing protein [Urbifossiella sp.]